MCRILQSIDTGIKAKELIQGTRRRTRRKTCVEESRRGVLKRVEACRVQKGVLHGNEGVRVLLSLR